MNVEPGYFKGETSMLSWGFATEGVCVRGGPHVAKQTTNRVKGAEKTKRDTSNRDHERVFRCQLEPVALWYSVLWQ